jgi:hypothetical protein
LKLRTLMKAGLSSMAAQMGRSGKEENLGYQCY